MATLTSSTTSQPQSWSKLFGNQRRRTYRSNYGSYSTYESASPSLEKSFHSKRYSSCTTQNGPSYDVTQNRYTGSRRGVSVDRDLDRHVRESESLFTSAYTKTSAHCAEYEVPMPRRRRYSLSLDREVGDMAPQPPRKRFTDVIDKQRQRRKLEMEKQEIEERRLEKQRGTSVRDIVARATEEEYAGFDYRTLLDGIPKRHRSGSMSYSETDFGTATGSRRSYYGHRSSSRASSVARSYLEDATEDFTSLRPRRRRSASVSLSRHDDVTDVDHYERKSHSLKQSNYEMSTVGDFEVARGRGDISSYVLDPNQPFKPDDIKVSLLPSGKRATTYTQSNQYGSQGHTKEANAEIEKVIQKTKIMQDSMHTLENFVRTNRSLFPEDTCVYQQIRFFQLTKEQLEQIGEHPDAVLYGVKFRERLVVPHGTDVTDILSRYYGNKENIEIEYSDSRNIKHEVEEEIESERAQTEKSIRKQVEADFEKRDAQRILGNESMSVRHATAIREQHDKYKHMHPHLTENYVRSFYVNAGLSFDYTPPQRDVRGCNHGNHDLDTYYHGYEHHNGLDERIHRRKQPRLRRYETDLKYTEFDTDYDKLKPRRAKGISVCPHL